MSNNNNEGTVIYFSLSDPSLLYSLQTQLFSSSSLPLFTAYSVSLYPLYWIYLANTTHTFSLPLSYSLYSPGNSSGASTLIVGKNVHGVVGGIDVDGCGWRDIPCLTIAKTVEHLDGADTVSLVSGTHPSETRQCVINESVTISGVGGTSQKEVSALCIEW